MPYFPINIKFEKLFFHEFLKIHIIFYRYPNQVDTVTWTWNQPHGARSVLWLTLTQPFSRASLEFLPVYHPSPEEIAGKYFRNYVKCPPSPAQKKNP